MDRGLAKTPDKPATRRTRPKKRGEGRKEHRNSLSPTSVIVRIGDFCENKCDGLGAASGSVSQRRDSDAGRKGNKAPLRARMGQNEEKGGRRKVGRKLYEMGKAKAGVGKWDDALMHFDRALCVQMEFLDSDHVAMAETLIGKGTAYAMLGSLYDSILDLEKALLLQRRASRNSDSLEVADTCLLVGHVQHCRGNFVEAAGSFHSALSIRERVLGMTDPRTAQVACLIASSYHQRRRYSEAAEGYAKVLAAYEAAGMRRDHPNVAWVRRRIADRNMFADRVANFWGDSNAV